MELNGCRFDSDHLFFPSQYVLVPVDFSTTLIHFFVSSQRINLNDLCEICVSGFSDSSFRARKFLNIEHLAVKGQQGSNPCTATDYFNKLGACKRSLIGFILPFSQLTIVISLTPIRFAKSTEPSGFGGFTFSLSHRSMDPIWTREFGRS